VEGERSEGGGDRARAARMRKVIGILSTKEIFSICLLMGGGGCKGKVVIQI
jgi:hypothetical protein